MLSVEKMFWAEMNDVERQRMHQVLKTYPQKPSERDAEYRRRAMRLFHEAEDRASDARFEELLALINSIK